MDRNLIDKQYRNYERVSRYSSFPFYYNTVDGKYIYGITSQLISDTSFTIHIASEIDSWDSLALKYYNNPTFWWVIAYFNDIQDAFKPLRNKYETIKIPSIASIEFGRINK